MLHSAQLKILQKGGARPMALKSTTIFMKSFQAQIDAVGFVPCRSAPARR
jgi:hypothetical protein